MTTTTKKWNEFASARYQKKNLINKQFRLNRNTNAEIIDYLDNIENFQGYIKQLIEYDMKHNVIKK